MIELEFSIMAHRPDSAEALRPLLDRFERQYRMRVSLTTLPWDTGWGDIVKMALYGHGPDVSEVGSTWVGSIAAMNALRPYTAAEVQALGGPGAFLPSAWRSGLLADDPRVWAVPWLGDTRVLYHRRDWLEEAGTADAPAAFATHASLEQTLRRLQDSRFAHPWAAYVVRSPNILHEVASWIWGAGGDFLSADGRQVLFAEPAARAGLHAYYDLRRYLPPAAHLQPVTDPATVFLQGQAAVAISGSWLAVYHRESDPELSARWGVAPVPGVPFTGGSSLVVWRHARHVPAAVELVQFLTGQPAQVPYSPHAALLPVRLAALGSLWEEGDPFYRGFIHGLRSGRTLPGTRLWGVVEYNLTEALAQVWAELLADPDADVEESLRHYLDPAARRLSLTLES
jgi:multiple sugar transport system substrate-binding protein